MRKAIVVVALSIAVVGVGIFWLASSTLRRDAAATLAAAEEGIAARTKVEFDGGTVSLVLLPAPSIVVRDLTVRRPHRGGVVAEGGTIRVLTAPLELAVGRLVPRSIELDGVRFTVAPFDPENTRELLASVRDVGVPVMLHACRIALDRADMPAFEMTSADLRLQGAGQGVSFRGAIAALGPQSHGDIDGEWRPGVGRTGGDGLRFQLHVADAAPDALAALLPSLRTTEIRGGAEFTVTADGFLGERTTENIPAEPLKGRIQARADFELFGLRKPAVFESGFALDDKRWALDSGQGRWGERSFTYAGTIARGFGGNRVNLRLGLRDVSVADVLADYGIAERWRPQATVTGEIRMKGRLDDPINLYEARMPSARFDGWPGVPVSAGPTSVNGSLLGINAEASASFVPDDFVIGKVHVPNPLIGVQWWRRKLNVMSVGRTYWDGKFDGAVTYAPDESSDVTGGGILRSADAATMLPALFPGLRIGVEGRIDVSLQGGYDARGLWYESRVALRYGAIRKGLLRSLLDQVARAAGYEAAIDDKLVAGYPALASDRISFPRLEAAFSAREGSVAVELSKLTSAEVDVRGGGTLGPDASLEANGAATFAPPVARALAQRVSPLGKLVAADGSLTVAFHLGGPIDDPAISLNPVFAAALDRASRGEETEPFVAPPASPLELKMGPLEEQPGF